MKTNQVKAATKAAAKAPGKASGKAAAKTSITMPAAMQATATATAAVPAPVRKAATAKTITSPAKAPAPPSGRVTLPAALEIAGIATMHADLTVAVAERCPKYLLDGSALSVIDTAGIQLLLAFIRQVTAQGSAVEWESYSIPVYQLASELGVAEQLGD